MFSAYQIVALTTFTTHGAAQAITQSTTGSTTAMNATQIAAAYKVAAYAYNLDFYNYVFIVLAALIVGFGFWRLVLESTKYVRLLTCLNNPTQNYFVNPSQAYATFKRSLLYAPIFNKRHNREFQLSRAINMGTLPTRFQLGFLLALFGTQIAFCVVSIHWDGSFSTVAQEVRNRTGILAVVNMVPLFIMASRNNPLISWLNLSFDTFNLLHRWFGRVVVLQAVAHTAAWTASKVKSAGWSAVWMAIQKSQMIMFGFIVSYIMCVILNGSQSLT